jgi:hypothetical protein
MPATSVSTDKLQNKISSFRRVKSRFVALQQLLHCFARRVLSGLRINEKVGATLHFVEQLQNCDALNNNRPGLSETKINNSTNLIDATLKPSSAFAYEKIGFDQCDVEMPCQVPTKRGFSNAVATVDRNDLPRQILQHGRQSLNRLSVAWLDGRHDDG